MAEKKTNLLRIVWENEFKFRENFSMTRGKNKNVKFFTWFIASPFFLSLLVSVLDDTSIARQIHWGGYHSRQIIQTLITQQQCSPLNRIFHTESSLLFFAALFMATSHCMANLYFFLFSIFRSKHANKSKRYQGIRVSGNRNKSRIYWIFY